MVTARGQCAAAFLYPDTIFAIGGGDTLNAYRSVESLDSSSYYSSWRARPMMNLRRNNPTAAVYKSTIIVAGGWNQPGRITGTGQANYVKETEIFTNNQWTILTKQESNLCAVSLLACEDGALAFGMVYTSSTYTCRDYTQTKRVFSKRHLIRLMYSQIIVTYSIHFQ